MYRIITLFAVSFCVVITNLQAQSISGTAWHDLNGNGTFDGGEPGIANVQVTLLTWPGLAPAAAATNPVNTDGAGNYVFTGMPLANYVVRFNQVPANPLYVFTILGGDSDAARMAPHDTPNFTYNGALPYPVLNAGLFLVASVGDRVWEDLNANGQLEGGEPTLPSNVNVTLHKASDNSVVALDANDNPLTNPVSTSNMYLFDNLIPGDYYIVFQEPGGANGLHLTLPDYAGGNTDATDDPDDSDADQVTGQTHDFALTSDEFLDLVDAGYYLLTSVGDEVWHDIDGDGENEGEGPLPSPVNITLYDDMGNLVTMDGLGNPIAPINTTSAYLFDNLIPGKYVVNFNEPGGATGLHLTIADFSGGTTDATDALDDSDADVITGDSHVITLNSADNKDRVDAGYYLLGSLGDYTWNDCNGDGRQDPSENGLGGVTIEITDDMGNPVKDPLTGSDILNVTSSGAGNFLFDHLPPGKYKLTFTPPANFYATRLDVVGGADDDTDVDFDSDVDIDNGDMTFVITIESDEDEEGVDAGYYEPVTLGDYVWHDANADGIQGASENGLNNIELEIEFDDGSPTTDVFGNTVNSVFSDVNGFYEFVDLRPGLYSVTVNAPAMWFLSPEDAGPDGIDSDFDMGGIITTPIQIDKCNSSAPIETVDAGLYKNIDVSGTVWSEQDDDGMQSGTENGGVGIEVEICNLGGLVIDTDITDAMGEYQFNVTPGNYIIKVTANNFGSGNPLNGQISCTPTFDPNNNIDLDDNGDGPSSGPVMTAAVELLCGDELGPDGTENNTIDFCFKFDCSAVNGLASLSCESVQDTFCNLYDLDIGCATMGTVLVPPFPAPLCPDGTGAAHNMSWFAFVAGSGDYTLQIEPTGCLPGAGGQLGVQAGIYTDCTFGEAVFCQGACSTAPINISSDNFIPGNVYYYFFDGCSGSVCSYNINILGDFIEFAIPDPIDVICDSGDCTDVCPGTDVTVKVADQFDGLNASYNWVVTDPSGGVTNVQTDINTLSQTLTMLGTYSIKIDYIYTKCSTSDLDQEILITVKNPDDENFGIVPICENILPGYNGPGSVNDAGVVTDPNGDGDQGWQANTNFVPGLNQATITVNGCTYDQEVMVLELQNTESTIDINVCSTDLPFFIGGFEVTQAVDPPIDLLVLNENNCDSIIHLSVGVISVDGQIVTVGCVPGGYAIQFNPNTSNPAPNVDVVWHDINHNIITDNDFIPNNLIVTQNGVYHVEAVASLPGTNCMPYVSNNIVVDLNGLNPTDPIASGPLGLCQGAAIADYVAQTSETNVTYFWTYPSNVASATGQGTDTLTINWGSSMGGDVCVYLSNVCGNSDTICQTVVITPIPTSALNSDPLTCVDTNATVTFTAPQLPGASYTWNFDGGSINNGGSPTGPGPFEISWPTSGKKGVSVQVTFNGCSSTIAFDSTDIVVPFAAPIIDCLPTGIGILSYTWNNPQGFVGYNVNVQCDICVTTPLENLNGTTLIVSDLPEGATVALILTTTTSSPCGDLVSQATCVSQNCVPPAISFVPGTGICVDGSTQPIDLMPVINPASNGTGVFSGVGITDPALGTFDPKLVPLTNGTGSSSVKYTYADADGCIGIGDTVITVNAIPVSPFSFEAVICELDKDSIKYTGTALSGSTYNWNFNGGTGGGNGPGPFNVEWSTPGTKTITLTVSRAGCTSLLTTKSVTVEPELEPVVPKCADQQPTEITFGWNSVSNSNGYTISVDGGTPINVTDTTYQITGLTPDATYTIEVLAKSANSCPSVVSTLACKAVSCPATFITLSIADTTICLNASSLPIDINSMVTGGLGDGSGVGQWFGQGVDPVTGVFDPKIAGIGIHNIDFLFTEGSCPSNIESVAITVISQPTSGFNGLSKICEKDPLILTYTGTTGVPLGWNLDNGVTIAPGAGANKFNVTFPGAGSYSIGLVTGNPGCESAETSLNVQVDPELDTVDINCASTLSSVTFTWNDINCASQYEVFINGVSQGLQSSLTYAVNNLNEGDARTIRVLPKSDCACPALATTLNCVAKKCPLVVINPTTPQNDFCAGDVTTSFSVSPNLTGSVSPGFGMWSGTGVDNTGLFNPNGLSAGVYDLTYDYVESSCNYSGKVTIKILPNPVVTVTPTDPVCYQNNVGSIVPSIEGGTGTYTYILDGNAVQLNQLNAITPGTHLFVVQDSKGCDDSANFNIGNAIAADVSIDGLTLVIKGREATITSKVNQINGSVDSIVWRTQDGQRICPSCTTVLTFAPLQDDIYCATFYYNNGCNVEECLEVRVETIIEIIIPNVFNPTSNTDDNKTFFMPPYANIASITSFSIYDRWGNKVFNIENYDPKIDKQGWDGKFAGGKEALAGVYVYKIDLVLTNGKLKTFEGDVTLVR